MNAIEQEVAKLSQCWDEFILGEQAILHWLINPADTLLVNAFVKIKEQFDEETGTWFIQLNSPFETAAGFGYSLAEEFNQLILQGQEEALEEEALEKDAKAAQHEQSQGTTPAPDLTHHWQKPDLTGAQSGLHALFISIGQVLALFDKSLEQLTLVINPSGIKNIAEYRLWWQQACNIARNYSTWPGKLKLLALDNSAQPNLTQTFAQCADVAKTQTPPINLNAAARAVAEQTHDGSDSAQLRLLFLQMNAAITEQNSAELNAAAEAALTITRSNQWPDMTATVLLTRAGGLLNLQQFPAALIDYQQAQLFARMGMENAVPGCEKLLLQALLFEGTANFLAQDLNKAVLAYEQAAQQAALLSDKWIALEAWRMAAFCSERLNQTERAWEQANFALAVGKDMAPEVRAQSTLGFVGQAMLRLKSNPQIQKDINATFSELLSSDWLEKLEGAAA